MNKEYFVNLTVEQLHSFLKGNKISGNGTLPPVLWVGASLNWNTPLTGWNQSWRKELAEATREK